MFNQVDVLAAIDFPTWPILPNLFKGSNEQNWLEPDFDRLAKFYPVNVQFRTVLIWTVCTQRIMNNI